MGGTEDSGATILQFPVVRREPPTIEAMTAQAPPRFLVASLVADAGFEVRDALRGFDREFDYLVRAIEMGSGPDDAITDRAAAMTRDAMRGFSPETDQLSGSVAL